MASKKPDTTTEKSKPPVGVRYSQEMGDRLVETVEEICSIKSTAKVLGVAEKTIYSWLQRYPDLKLRVQIAQRKYYSQQDTENVHRAKETIKKYLTLGNVTTKKFYDANGNLERSEVTQSPPPAWIIDRVLGTNNETEALKALLEAQWIPDQLAMNILESIEDTQTSIKGMFQKSLTTPPTE